MLRWRRRRSNGVVVTERVFRMIEEGDGARSRRNWAGAAAAYARVVADEPSLAHIGIQLGHALKEEGRVAEAEQAYRGVFQRNPGHRDAALHLAHTVKLSGSFQEAAELYVSLVVANPDDEEATREARETIGFLDATTRGRLAAILSAASLFDDVVADDSFPPVETCVVVYDASDLLSYFSHSRRPTGIQRVQIEIISHALSRARDRSERVGVCCFVEGRDEWVAVPTAAFLSLAEASFTESEGADWRRLRDAVHLHLLTCDPCQFAMGAVLVNLGTSWWLKNYFLHVRTVQAQYGLVYIPLIHDMIPVLFPDYCIDALVQDFVSWLAGVFDHARCFLAVSESSKRDLIETAQRLGRIIEPDDVGVVPLGASIGQEGGSEPAALQRSDRPYILFVSTIEPRKGHLVAFDAWSALAVRLPAGQLPTLVCVGRNGWRNERVMARLEKDAGLRDHVVLLRDLSDAELDALYRDSLFTIYPSLYEGWGLPVSEALCRGKLVITTTSSSLPEAGGRFACFVPPDDSEALSREIERLVRDPAELRERERIIRKHYQPRGWNEVARHCSEAIAALARRSIAVHGPAGFQQLPIARLGRFYWLGRSRAMELAPVLDDGEIFRAGANWSAPDDWGCRIRRSGAVLSLRVEQDAGADVRQVRITLRLLGSDDRALSFMVAAGGDRVGGVLARREHRSVTIAPVSLADSRIEVRISSEQADQPSVQPAVRAPPLIGVIGFLLERA